MEVIRLLLVQKGAIVNTASFGGHADVRGAHLIKKNGPFISSSKLWGIRDDYPKIQPSVQSSEAD